MAFFTGIGSRSTPPKILDCMYQFSAMLVSVGWTLRSGGASGADTAFEIGSDRVVPPQKKEIYLPWKGFNKSDSPFTDPTTDALELASNIHPAWRACTRAARLLHARNCHQILGYDLKTPSSLVICWTREGKVVGGTATALRLARTYKIPIINLALIDNLDKYFDLS